MLGLIMVGVGVFGIVRARRSPGGPAGVGAGPGGGVGGSGVGAAAVPPASRATGRATARGAAAVTDVVPDDRPPPDDGGPWPAGVYTSSTATGYADVEPGFDAAPRGGRTYGGGTRYPDQPTHPDEHGGREYGGGTYRGGDGYGADQAGAEDPRGRYEVDRYGGRYHDGGYGQPPFAGGEYAGQAAGYGSAAPPASDGSAGYYPEDWSDYSGPGQQYPDAGGYPTAQPYPSEAAGPGGYPYRYGEPEPEHR
jgi:hypothetical protein